jgi:hypothetical protein
VVVPIEHIANSAEEGQKNGSSGGCVFFSLKGEFAAVQVVV